MIACYALTAVLSPDSKRNKEPLSSFRPPLPSINNLTMLCHVAADKKAES